MTTLGTNMVEAWMERYERAREEVLLASLTPGLFTDKWTTDALDRMRAAQPEVDYWHEVGGRR